MPTITTTVETVQVDHCDFEAKVRVGGEGPPLVFLHAAGGPRWDAFTDALAEHYTVYAPDHPGTGETARDSIYRVEDLWDLVLIYDEMLDKLNLESPAIVGTSFGGMVACELAAHRRRGVAQLVLIDPIGLWRDDAPVLQWMLLEPDQVAPALFDRLDAAPVQEHLQAPDDPEQLAEFMADSIWALGTTGKFVWPIPDRGLSKRLHRITAPSLIIWGENDRLISSVYADEFAQRLTESKIEIIDGTGHAPHLEALDTVAPMVIGFLAER